MKYLKLCPKLDHTDVLITCLSDVWQRLTVCSCCYEDIKVEPRSTVHQQHLKVVCNQGTMCMTDWSSEVEPRSTVHQQHLKVVCNQGTMCMTDWSSEVEPRSTVHQQHLKVVCNQGTMCMTDWSIEVEPRSTVHQQHLKVVCNQGTMCMTDWSSALVKWHATCACLVWKSKPLYRHHEHRDFHPDIGLQVT